MNARRTSTAVMARRVEPADSLDFFPTPPWATRAFCEHVLPAIEPGAELLTAFDPACGEGHMALALADYFSLVHASDIFDYGFGQVADFLHPDDEPPAADWIFTNPPFNLAGDFVIRALQLARRGVAMLVRTQFQEGEERHREIFAPHPPALIAQYIERVPMHRGRWVINGKSATAYEWFVWLKQPGRDAGTGFRWIPKSRLALSRHDDWLTFSGCMDLPKDHAALRRQEYREPVLTLDQVRAEKAARLANVRQNLELLL
jgi:hypothetical protein